MLQVSLTGLRLFRINEPKAVRAETALLQKLCINSTPLKNLQDLGSGTVTGSCESMEPKPSAKSKALESSEAAKL